MPACVIVPVRSDDGGVSIDCYGVAELVTRCGIGLLGLGSTPLRGAAGEQAVAGRAVADITAEEVGRVTVGALTEIPADLQGSATYRARVGAAMVARAWESAVQDALIGTKETVDA